MIKSNRKRTLMTLAIIISVLGGGVATFQGCGGQLKKTQFLSIEEETQTPGPNGNTPGDGFAPGPDGTMRPVENKTAAVTSSETIIASLLATTGVTTPSAATRGAVTREIGKISETGKADSVNGPMWLAITNLSGEVCNDLIAQEAALAAASRRIFGLVDLTTANAPASAVSAAAQDDVIRRLARSVWQRNETPEEATMIKSATATAFSAGTARNAMLYMCTAMLASLDAHDL